PDADLGGDDDEVDERREAAPVPDALEPRVPVRHHADRDPPRPQGGQHRLDVVVEAPDLGLPEAAVERLEPGIEADARQRRQPVIDAARDVAPHLQVLRVAGGLRLRVDPGGLLEDGDEGLGEAFGGELDPEGRGGVRVHGADVGVCVQKRVARIEEDGLGHVLNLPRIITSSPRRSTRRPVSGSAAAMVSTPSLSAADLAPRPPETPGATTPRAWSAGPASRPALAWPAPP